jgi:hypothetical protein
VFYFITQKPISTNYIDRNVISTVLDFSKS